MPPDPAQTVPTAITELRCHPHWVIWREEKRDDKTTKVPYVATAPQRRASSTDPATWSAYGDAAKAVRRGRAKGLGYVFSPHDEYTGVDLDKCVTEGHVEPAAMDIVRRLDSYTELSPTGTGLHIIVRGAIRGDRKRTGKTPWGGEFESYDQGRFFTITERHLDGAPKTIEARQDELDAIRAQLFPPEPRSQPSPGSATAGISDDEKLLERARKAKNGRDFEALYSGDLSRHGDDESAADLALCNMLAFWAGPHPDRIDSLFRRSGLMREKWDSPRPGGTYGSQTIDKALSDRTEYFTGGNGSKPAALRYADRQSAEQAAREELTTIFGLDDLALTITGGTRTTRDTKARVILEISDGSTLDLDPIGAYSTAPKLTNEVAIQLGAEPDLKGRVPRVLALLRTICDLREEFTLDERAIDFAISFLQEAKVRPVDMDDQADRFAAFFELAGKHPVVNAKTEGSSIAAESVVLEDRNTGLRYVRGSWFNAYVKAQTSPGVADDVGRRMRNLGWSKPGSEGRVKATAATGEALIWAFFTVPAGWERD